MDKAMQQAWFMYVKEVNTNEWEEMQQSDDPDFAKYKMPYEQYCDEGHVPINRFALFYLKGHETDYIEIDETCKFMDMGDYVLIHDENITGFDMIILWKDLLFFSTNY